MQGLLGPCSPERLIPQTLKELHTTKEQLKLSYEILETKNSWGNNEIRALLLEIVSGIRTSK